MEVFKEKIYRNYKKPKLVLYLQVRLERENKKLLADNLRLDTENDNLARELLTSKIEMRKEFDEIEDTKDFFEKELEATKSQLAEVFFSIFGRNKIMIFVLCIELAKVKCS